MVNRGVVPVIVTSAENVFAPLKVCVPLRCAVSASRYAEAIAVPCHTPVAMVPTAVIFVWDAVCNAPANCVAVSLPVLGLYVRLPSDSNPIFPPSTSPPDVKTTALS